MLMRRVIACLDVQDARVVKGTRFIALRDVGDPAELAERYEAEGADEIVFLDVTATSEDRPAMLEVLRQTAERLFIPLTVGGGMRSCDDIALALRAGADKVSLNSAAVANPALLTRGANRFGRQCIVASIDARRVEADRTGDPSWTVVTHGGRRDTGLDAIEWAEQCAELGAGEILLTSIDHDGGRAGYDLPLLQAVRRVVDVSLIASGGAGTPEHSADACNAGADAALVAGILHDGITSVREIKQAMRRKGHIVRGTISE
jgi:imidazole glycerol-phosphate synthase subunit HisF